jgi:hypothetical protein
MMGEQIGKPMLAQPDTHEALQDVQIGVPVAFDEDRPVFQDGDIPADDHTIIELAVRRDRKLFGFLPIRHVPSMSTPASSASRDIGRRKFRH